MEIVFAGICCWIDSKPPRTGKTVIIPNSTRGGAHHGVPIPPHTAFVHAKTHQVEGEWLPAFSNDDNLIFLLNGDEITFDPMPVGGSIDIHDLPHVRARGSREPICPAADEIRPGFLESPAADNVMGIVHIPADAPVSTSANAHGAMFATLHMPDGPVTITATPFGGGSARSLRVTDPAAHVVIGNVTLMDYLLSVPAPDDDHQYLVCEMFRPRTKAGTIRLPPNAYAPMPSMTAELSEGKPIEPHKYASVNITPRKPMQDFLCTFAVGCSDSQWP